MKQRWKKSALACCLVVLMACVGLPVSAAQAPADYAGTVLMAVNTDRGNSFARFTTDRTETDSPVEAARETPQDKMLPDILPDDPEPLSGAEALLRQAQVGDTAPQARADYRVGDTKRIYSHYAASEGKNYRRVDLICTSVSDTATVWRERGTEAEHTEFDEKLAAELDERLPKELEFFGDKRVDTDGDGRIAVFLYKIDGVNIGGYFSTVDLMDSVGRIGPVWHPYFSTSNHMDCIHVQGGSSYSFAVETCLHEYQHYIQASYRFVGRNNFTVLDATETFVNEGFSTGVEYLLFGVDRYSDDFAYAARPSNGLSFLNWEHDNGNYSMAFVFSQYIRTRYAAMTDDLDSDIPGGSVYKTILEARTPKNDDDTMAVIADLLYPADAYPELRSSETRCTRLLQDFWLAVFLQEPEGVHGFNGESWVRRIRAAELVQPMPAGETPDPVRSGMAAFYQITTNDTDSVRVTRGDDALTFAVPPQQGYTLRFDAAGGTGAPQAVILEKTCRIPYAPTRAGYTFLGWALTPDAAAVRYRTGDTVRLSSDLTLYALWAESPVVETDTVYPVRRQGSESSNNYRFTPPTDGIYKLTVSIWYDAALFTQGAETEPLWVHDDRDGSQSYYYRLTGGSAYDLTVSWPSYWVSGAAFCLTLRDTYYTLTYRIDHPLAQETWSYAGETTYTAEEAFPKNPVFLGWAYAPDAQTPDVLPGDTLTLTQDTTLYAVCVPETPLPTDGSPAAGVMRDDKCLFVLHPQESGMYALAWQTEGDSDDDDAYDSAVLLDERGRELDCLYPGDAVTCALGGGTYYLRVRTDRPDAVFTCQKTSDRVRTTLRFDVGDRALFNLELHGKTVYTVPRYTPVSVEGREFVGWAEESGSETYATGDTITVTGETVLTAQWSDAPQEPQAYSRAMVRMPGQFFRTMWHWLAARIGNAFMR